MSQKNKACDGDGFNYMRELQRYPVIRNKKEVAQLVERWRTHKDKRVREAAYDQLVYGNSKLVFSIARRYTNFGMSLYDLLQEGFIGLMRAIETFNPQKGMLSTYATFWIRLTIIRALADQSRTIRIPVFTVGRMTHVNRILNEFFGKHNRFPTDQEAYDAIHAKDGTAYETVVGKNMKLKDVKSCRALSCTKTVSLDAPPPSNHANESHLSLGEVIIDSKVDTEAIVEVSRMQKAALERLKHRTTGKLRTLTILRMRFELNMTLEDTGQRIGITKERVRQIEKNILTKIAKDLKTTYECVKQILAGLPLGVEEEKLITPENVLPKKFSISHLFKILCEHLIFTPSEQRIVKEPLLTLQIREELQLLPNEAEVALQKMRAAGLIQGDAPWTIIQILPEVNIPKFPKYKH